MAQAILDETGNRYGILTVTRFAEVRRGKAYWLCKCDCGNQCVVRGSHLRSGGVNSCGCLVRLSRGKAAFNRLLGSYRRSARKRGIPWRLTRQQFAELTQQECHYCGAAPSQVSSGQRYNGQYEYNGVDRKDNTKGYSPDNVVACCWHCNRMKGDLGYQEFLALIRTISQRFEDL